MVASFLEIARCAVKHVDATTESYYPGNSGDGKAYPSVLHDAENYAAYGCDMQQEYAGDIKGKQVRNHTVHLAAYEETAQLIGLPGIAIGRGATYYRLRTYLSCDAV